MHRTVASILLQDIHSGSRETSPTLRLRLATPRSLSPSLLLNNISIIIIIYSRTVPFLPILTRPLYLTLQPEP